MVGRKIISYFLVALFVSYYSGMTFFSHTHIISGATITHSHIHTDSHHNTQSGDHSEHSITLIAQVSHFESIDFLYVETLHNTMFLLNEVYFAKTTPCVLSVYSENISLRAPPPVV